MKRPFALPGARPRYAPDRLLDVQHIQLEVRLDVADKRIDGVCRTTLAPIVADVRQLELDAVEMDIQEVRLEGSGGGEHNFASDGKKLRIELAPPAKKARPIGKPFTVESFQVALKVIWSPVLTSTLKWIVANSPNRSLAGISNSTCRPPGASNSITMPTTR